MKNEFDSEIVNLVIDISEAGLDQLINDPLIKDIPLLGTAVNIARIGKTISDRIFLSKVKTFLETIRDGKIDWISFSDQLKTDENLKRKLKKMSFC